jgi:hypothetical protein
VYDRPKHLFTVKDLERISRAIPIPSTIEEFLALGETMLRLYLNNLRAVITFVGYEKAFSTLLHVVKGAIDQIWGLLFNSSKVPVGYQPSVSVVDPKVTI